ncbi:MAG TPA: ArsR family transcriptional regulator [Candidatus Thermoplasmatota archaeon]|nr:ArsR family transcriptional regulator [Candidatus Thermoplasmatota archaeon]
MRRDSALVLGDREEHIAKLLMDLGLSRSIAKTLVFLDRAKESVSSDIEHGAGLRQPEVSVAMQLLRERGWVDKHDLKKEGKGRPVHCYRLLVTLESIVSDIEREKREEAERNFETIQKLRTLQAEG